MISGPIPVLDNERLSERLYRMTLESAAIARESRPGQFVTVRVSSEYDPLLRRPLGIHRITNGNSCLQILYRVVGKGTELLSRVSPGEELDVLGPLGTGFTPPGPGMTALLVAGGIGIAPMLYFAEALLGSSDSPEILLYFGGVTKVDLVVSDDFDALGVKTALTTEDGTRGRCGMITEALELDLGGLDAAKTMIYACGPMAMLKNVAALAQSAGMPCEVSLERRMACGVGACMGCVTEVLVKKGDSESISHERVCNEGPVFDAGRIVWNDV